MVALHKTMLPYYKRENEELQIFSELSIIDNVS